MAHWLSSPASENLIPDEINELHEKEAQFLCARHLEGWDFGPTSTSFEDDAVGYEPGRPLALLTSAIHPSDQPAMNGGSHV